MYIVITFSIYSSEILLHFFFRVWDPETQETLKTNPETNSGVDKSCDNFIEGLFDNKDKGDDALLEDSSDIANDSLDNSAIGKKHALKK